MTRFTDPLPWLFGLEQFGIKFGLDNITAILEALGHPDHAFRAVHIAGTNGKGSVTAMVDAALRAAGHRSARYTSPHLLDLAERFVIDGRPVALDALRAVVADLRETVDRLQGSGLQGQPTFFEVTTAAAFELFRRAAVDVAVCEVGLGGRLDATNVLEPVVTAITSIGFDHEQYLGSTLRQIAIEKAGILKHGIPVVVGNIDGDAYAAIAEIANSRGCEIVRAADGVELQDAKRNSGGTVTMKLRTPARDYGDLTVGLRGAHQVRNALVAVRVLELLDRQGTSVSPEAVMDGLSRVEWPGRLELRRLPDGREVLLDAAHNPDGAAALAAFLQETFPGPVPLVFAAMRDKDAAGMARCLAPVAAAFIVTRASNPRSADPAELADRIRAIAPRTRVDVEPSVADAMTAAWRIAPRIVVAGSIFLIGDVMKAIGTT